MTVIETRRSGIIVSGGGDKNPSRYVSEKVMDSLKGGLTDKLHAEVSPQCEVRLHEGQKVTISTDGRVAYTESGEVVNLWGI